MAQLVFIDGKNMGTIVPLADQNRLGSGGDNEIIISEPGVLENHARLSLSGDTFSIATKAGATVNVNGRPVDDEILHHGDIITLGEVSILFSDESPIPSESTQGGETSDDLTTSIVESRVKHFLDPEDALTHIKRNERLTVHVETLYRFGAELNATMNMDDLLKIMSNHIFEVFSPDRAFIFLADEQQKMHLRSQRGSEQSSLRGFQRVSQTILNQAIERGEAFLTKEAGNEMALHQAQSIVDQNIQSAMSVPIIRNNQILGVVYLDTLTTFKTYTSEDLHLINALAAQAALAIQNVSNYNRQLEHSRKLLALGELSRKVSSFLSRNNVIRQAVEGTLNLFDCKKCTILMLDDDGDWLRVAHSNWIEPDLWKEISVKPGEGLCGKVLQNNTALLVRDASEVPETGKRQYETSSFLIVPIISRAEGIQAQSKPVGVICVTDSAKGRTFDEDDKEFLIVMASQLGIALNNARLYERATVDALTRVFTRPFFFSQFADELLAHKVRKSPLSVFMIDIDHFKEKNDQLGHQAGDDILAELGSLLRDFFLPLGFVARYGGEEFVAILRSTDAERARKIAEDVRGKVEKHDFPIGDGETVKCSVSIGVAEIHGDDDMDDIVFRADAALYQAKNAGRNKVEVFDAATTTVPTQTGQTRKRQRPR